MMDRQDKYLSERYEPKASSALANRIVSSIRKQVETGFSFTDIFTPQYSFAMVAILLVGLNVGFDSSFFQSVSVNDSIYSDSYDGYSFDVENFI